LRFAFRNFTFAAYRVARLWVQLICGAPMAEFSVPCHGQWSWADDRGSKQYQARRCDATDGTYWVGATYPQAGGGNRALGQYGGMQAASRGPARCLWDKDLEMRFKPTVDQLCTIADMTVARMTPDFIANRIGVPFDDYRAWRQRLLAATHADDANIAARPVPVAKPGIWK
jgi:hypothetical protein